ncbi:27692_t:CDS:2, partial [Dentiscutata erythropus]
MLQHRLSQFDKFETSQFRLRAPKTSKKLSFDNDKNSSIHSYNESQSWQYENEQFDDYEFSINENINNLQFDDDEFNSDDWDSLSLNNIQYENESCNTDSRSQDTDNEAENLSEIFDEPNFDLKWNQECQFGTFENFTTMAMFVWTTKHMISTAAYQYLIQILIHSQFEKSHLIFNLQSLKKYHEKLPLMQIKSHNIPINTRNIPSTTKNSTRVYYFSLIEHLQ